MLYDRSAYFYDTREGRGRKVLTYDKNKTKKQADKARTGRDAG